MLPSDITIEVRNPDFTRAGQLTEDDLTDVLIVPTMNDLGTWSISLPDKHFDEATGSLVPHALCAALRVKGSGIIVTGPGGVILSGPMDEAQMVRRGEDPNGTWEFTGVSDLCRIADDIAYGDPSTFNLAAQTTSNDTRTDEAESLILGYIGRNIGPTAVVQRKWSFLTLASDLARGPVLTKSPRMQNLLELVKEILTGTNLLVDVVQDGDDLEVRVAVQEDRTDLIRMDFDNEQLERVEYGYSAPTLTEVIVAGQGEGTARTMRRRTVADGGWGRRIVEFLDERNTDVAAELDQAGDEELADAAAKETAFQVVPNVDLGLVYGVDWKVGDIVAVVIGDTEIPVPVTTAPIRISSDGVFVGATVGSPLSSDPVDILSVRQQQLDARLSRLERAL